MELRDLRIKLKLLDDFASGTGESSDVGAQVPGELSRVVKKSVEVERAGVVELLARHGLKDRADIVD